MHRYILYVQFDRGMNQLTEIFDAKDDESAQSEAKRRCTKLHRIVYFFVGKHLFSYP